jgi:vancomycin resistance protein VanJ
MRPHCVSPTTTPPSSSPTRLPAARGGEPGGAAPSTTPRPRRSLRGLGVAVAALILALGILFAADIPSLDGIGSAWTSFLPWTAVPIVVLAAAAAIRRSWWAASAVIITAMVWSVTFVPQLLPGRTAAGADVLLATQNIGAGNADPAASVRGLLGTGAGLVAVQEIASSAEAAIGRLDDVYADSVRVSTVGLWSQWALDDPEPLELGLSWARAFRTVVHHPDGDIAVYTAHLPSVRPGDTAARDRAVTELAALVANDSAARVLVLGDLNTATTDTAFTPLTDLLADSRQEVGGGFGFTWPAAFPLTRPDHVLAKGLTPVSDQVLASGGSDHRLVLVGLQLA